MTRELDPLWKEIENRRLAIEKRREREAVLRRSQGFWRYWWLRFWRLVD